MVARHGLVQRERLERVERTALERVGVDPVGPGAGAVERRADVAAAGVLRGEVVGHGLDAVRLARQPAEERRQLAVHALRDPGRLLQELVGGLRVEARVAAQELEELGERALEADLASRRRPSRGGCARSRRGRSGAPPRGSCRAS